MFSKFFDIGKSFGRNLMYSLRNRFHQGKYEGSADFVLLTIYML